MNTSVLAEPHGEAFIDIRELIARLIANWKWIALSVILCTAVAAAVAFLSTRIYRASIVLIAANADNASMGGVGAALGQLGGLASLAGINIGTNASDTEEALAVLKSRQFTEAFIADSQLMPLLFAKAWDKQSGTWKADVKVPTPGKAYKYFDKRVRSITRDKKTNLVTLTIEWRDREQAASWANDLVQRLNAEMRSRAIARTTASVGYLEKELEGTSIVATREAINRLIETQIKQRMLANVTHEYAFRVVDKAVPPDADDPIKPKKFLLLLGGPSVGFTIGVALVLLPLWLWGRTGLGPRNVQQPPHGR